MNNPNGLPWICEDHPDAKIRRSWDQNHYVLNGYPAGLGWKTNVRYECAECGKELAPGDESKPNSGAAAGV
jgi:hypothetical protein